MRTRHKVLIAIGGGLLLAALLLWLDLWLDARWTRQFVEDEQITVRPEPRYRPRF
jgi:hypothetical protein